MRSNWKSGLQRNILNIKLKSVTILGSFCEDLKYKIRYCLDECVDSTENWYTGLS